MKSKTSVIDQGILRNDFKSLGWIGAGYLLGMLLSLPLKILMLHSKVEHAHTIQNPDTYLRLFQFDSPLQIMLLILVPVLAGLWLFRYLQTNHAADMVHALPVKRVTLYNTHILAGFIFLGIPLVITALISWALIGGLGISNVSGLDICYWLSISLLINLLFFMTSVATGMFTGLSTVQGVLSYILLLLPFGLLSLLLFNMKMYVYGFPYDYYGYGIEFFSPLLRMTNSFGRYPMQAKEIIIYLLISIAFYLAGRYLYQRRHLETAGSAITFNILRPIFKYGVTFCFMLLLGSYFNNMQNTMAWTYFGYFLGSLLAYFLVEILLTKSLRVFRFNVIKGWCIYALIVIGIIGVMNFDCAGYEKRLPELSEIESVYMDNYFSALNNKDHPRLVREQDSDMEYGSPLARPLPVYTKSDDIKKIYALHQKIIANRGIEKNLPYSQIIRTERSNISLAYTLKDGSHIYRQYNINTPKYTDQLKPIYETREYKDLHYPILRIDPAKIKMLEIDASDVNKSVRIIDPKFIEGAIAALQADVIAQTYEEMTREMPAWADITINLDNNENRQKNINFRNKSIHLSWEKSYINFEQWLKDNHEYHNARIIPGEDIAYAVVARKTADTPNEAVKEEKTITSQAIIELANDSANLKISEPDKLETCLRKYKHIDQQSDYSKENGYNIFFFLKNGSSFAGGFTEDDTPDFVKEFYPPF